MTRGVPVKHQKDLGTGKPWEEPDPSSPARPRALYPPEAPFLNPTVSQQPMWQNHKAYTVTSGWRHMGLRKSHGLGTVSPRNSQGHFSNDGLLPYLNRITGQKSLTQIHLGSRTELNPGIWLPERSIMVSCTEYYGILNIIFWCVTKYWASLTFFARI